MPYADRYSEQLTDILKKLKQRDTAQFEIIRKKIQEILSVLELNPDHYKPLSHSMKGFKRVHIYKSFVLIFKVDAQNKIIWFEDYDHHDNMYRKYH